MDYNFLIQFIKNSHRIFHHLIFKLISAKLDKKVRWQVGKWQDIVPRNILYIIVPWWLWHKLYNF
jgi:hypothetical protein